MIDLKRLFGISAIFFLLCGGVPNGALAGINDCPICLGEVEEGAPSLACKLGHKIDKDCLQLQVEEGLDQFKGQGIRCWGDGGKCKETLPLADVAKLLGLEEPLQDRDEPGSREKSPQSELDAFLLSSKNDLGSQLGFANLGATCFANSVFKLLSVHPDILSITPELSSHKNKLNSGVQHAFSDLMRKYHASAAGGVTRDRNGYTSELHTLYDEYENYLKKRQGGDPYISNDGDQKVYLRRSQADAAEFMTGLLDVLGYAKFFHPFTQMSQVYFPSTQHYSIGGAETIMSLDLPIHHDSIKSVSDALTHYFAAETLSEADGVQNERNRNIREGITKRPVLIAKDGQIPKQIVLTIKRFQWNQYGRPEKLGKKIEVPFKIELPYYLNTQSAQSKEQPLLKEMRLTAVIVHYGSHDFGHYTAYTYHAGSDTWLEHNDRSVSKSDMGSEMKTLRRDGYVFLYEAL